MKPTRVGAAWTAAALIGIVVTAALTWSVSRLAGQRIGLSSAPPSAISGLAPVHPARHAAGAAPDPTPSERVISESADTGAGTPPPARSAPVAPTATAVGPTPAASPPPAVNASSARTPSVPAFRSSGRDGGGDGHGASARSGGGRDD